MKLFRNWWFVSITCALLLALLFAFGLPMLFLFFRPIWIRVLFVLLVAAIWGMLVFLRWRKAKRAADAIAAELTPPNAADEEGKALADRMRLALGELKKASGKKRDYLYTRPWYVIIGPPGAGKTTALLNSGLRFPFGDQAVKGVGGTRNLDFWFADEAVMIDTAGRYTTQDSDLQVDSAGWSALLSLLKRNRPLQPVNGMIVAIGVDELIALDCAGIDAHARAVRRRLAEMRRTLEVAAPVYVMLTKADLLSGFTEYFADLDVEGRRAVAGSTLPVSAAKPTSEALAHAFDEMAQALTDRQAKRLYEEVDARRRSLLLGFPSQLQSLRSRLMRFLDGVFVSADEPAGTLRGFYLTSGTQEGAPLDRILSSLVEVYDMAPEPVRASQGRTYFLNRLLTEVLFPEAGLVTMDVKARLRQRSQLIGAFAGIGLTCVLLLLLWTVSFANNRGFQQDVLTRTAEVRDEIGARGVDVAQVRDATALREAIPILDKLRALPHGYDERRRKEGDPSLTMTFGLYQSGLSKSAEDAYLIGLRRILLPRVVLRLEQYLDAHQNDPRVLFEPLKAYLLLGGSRKMEAGAVRGWVMRDWEEQLLPGADAAPDRATLARHLDALLADRDMAAAWPGGKAPLSATVVANAREALGHLDPADRAYALFKQNSASPDKDWFLATYLGPGEEAAFADPKRVLAIRIPYFFRRKGFEEAYAKGKLTIESVFIRDYWVFDDKADASHARAEAKNVGAGIAGLYAKDYIAAWQGVIDALKPVDYFDKSNRAAFGAFTRAPSPLKRILSQVRENTSFAGGVAAAGQRAVDMQIARSRFGGYIRDMEKGRTTGLDAGSEISNYFGQLNEYVGDDKGGKLDDFVAALKRAVSAAIAADPSQSVFASTDPVAMANGELQTAAAEAPDLIKPFIDSAARRGATVKVEIEAGQISSAYSGKVLQDCRTVTENRFPFDGKARENASAGDMDRVFGRGGTIDAFVAQVQPLIQTGPIWRWNTENSVAASLNPESPAQFARAAEIRDLINVGLPLQVSIYKMGSSVTSVDVTSNDTTRSFNTVTDPPQPLQWSLRGLQQAAVVLHTSGGQVRIPGDGPWALFRLMERASSRQNDGQKIRFGFGSGASSATLLVTLPSQKDPFDRNGIWLFSCPSTL